MFPGIPLFLLLGVVVPIANVLGAPPTQIASGENVGCFVDCSHACFKLLAGDCLAILRHFRGQPSPPRPPLFTCRGSHGLSQQFRRNCKSCSDKVYCRRTREEQGLDLYQPWCVFAQRVENPPINVSCEGGPGGAGTVALPVLAQSLSAIFDGQYDIVSWDPRGSMSFHTLYGFLSNTA